MKVALVSKTNGTFGGASYFAENLAAWLLDSGQEVVHFCVSPRNPLREFQRNLSCRGLPSRLVRHLNWRARRLGLVEPFPWEYWFGLKQITDSFDVFHFHDLYMAISPRTLGAIARRRPVAFTVHDCSAFTGGCQYPMECARFRESCGGCPKLREIGRVDFTRSNLKRLRRLARCSAVNYAFPSRWIQDEASRSLRFVGEAVHLPNGFDPRPYDYRSRNDARTALGLDHKKKIVAVSSASLEDNRKGLAFALRALAANRDLSPHVVIIGQSPPGIDQALQGLDFTLAGFVTERSKLGLFFAAADLLLFTSLADNLPITIQEAMAASTPVLAFNVGGVPELVRPGFTGWLVPKGDQEALNRQLREVLQSSDTIPFGDRAQVMMREEFSAAACVDRHVNLYRKVLESAHSRRGGL